MVLGRGIGIGIDIDCGRRIGAFSFVDRFEKPVILIAGIESGRGLIAGMRISFGRTIR